jgi:glutathione S-transferase
MTGMVLYGLDGNTYVRTVRMLLAEKGVHYEQVPVNLLEGQQRRSDGKVPVLDHDGFRVVETGGVAPYLD